MASLQEQYNLIQEGKSTAKDVFLKHAKSLFPQYIPNHFDFELTTKILKQKSIITEGYVDLQPLSDIQASPKESWENSFAKFLKEEKETEEKKIKADLKKTDKSVEDIQDNDYDQKNMKTVDNVIFDQLQRGVYTEMSKDPDQDLKKVKDKVLKNLAKDPIYYTKNSAFGLEIPGYTDKLPGANPPKSDKMEPVSKEKIKSNVQDSLGKKEAASKGTPKEVKSEMTQNAKSSKGVKKMDMPGKEKKINLKEHMEEAMVQGTIVNPKNSGSGEQKIPRAIFLPQDAINKINNKFPGSIKVISKGKETALLISQLFAIALGALTRGRYSPDTESKKPELAKLASEALPPAVRGKIKKELIPKPVDIAGNPMHYTKLKLIPKNDGSGYWIPSKGEFEPLVTENNSKLRSVLKSIIREVLTEENIEEGALDDAVAASEKKVDQKKIELATAEKELATKKEQEAKASQAG